MSIKKKAPLTDVRCVDMHVEKGCDYNTVLDHREQKDAI